MAILVTPTALYVESYEGKPTEWLKARLEHLERLELTKESIPRRRDIRRLRMELRKRPPASPSPPLPATR